MNMANNINPISINDLKNIVGGYKTSSHHMGLYLSAEEVDYIISKGYKLHSFISQSGELLYRLNLNMHFFEELTATRLFLRNAKFKHTGFSY